MLQYRRLAALILGIWLGAGVFADIAVTQNFKTVDRFLTAPGSTGVSIELNRTGRLREREILRRNAGEENNFLFESWERAELILGAVLFGILFLGERPGKLMLALALIMWVMVLVQRFWLSPEVAELGRKIADLPAGDPLNGRFWTLHGVYSGVEILKLLVGAGLAVRLAWRPKLDRDHFAKKYEAEAAAAARIRRQTETRIGG